MLYHPVKILLHYSEKKKPLKIAYLLSTEGYKNINQELQEKYKKKATSKGMQQIQTSISLKRFGKCRCFSSRWIESMLQQNLPMSSHIVVGKSTLVTTFKRDNGFLAVVRLCVSVTNALREKSCGRGKMERTSWDGLICLCHSLPALPSASVCTLNT